MTRHAGFFILFSAIVVLAAALRAGTYDAYMDSTRAMMLLDGQRFLLSDRFDNADSVFAGYGRVYPHDPAGDLFCAGVLMARMTDREEQIDNEQFLALLDTADARVDRALDTATDRRHRAWLYLYRGHASAYRSLWQARFGSFISSVRLAMKARDAYEQGLNADSTLYDLYLGTGAYHYWKSAKAGVLRVIGIFRDEKDRGIEELKLAIDSSIISSDPARSALAWIWLDREQYDSAIAVCRTLLADYPNGKSFLWPLARALFEKKDYRQALDTYRLLREQIARDPGNYYNLIECDARIGECLEAMGFDDQAQAAAREARRYDDAIPKQVRRRQRHNLDYLRRLAR